MQGFCDIDTPGGSAKWPSNLLGSHHWRDSRAHQAPFYARELSEISAVSENAPGAHRDVPRIGGGSTDGSVGGRAYRWQRERGNRVTYGTPIKLSATRGYFFFTKCELRNQILSYCLSNTPENISISLPEIPNRVANLRHPFTTSITSEIIFSAVFRLSI